MVESVENDHLPAWCARKSARVLSVAGKGLCCCNRQYSWYCFTTLLLALQVDGSRVRGMVEVILRL